MTTMEQASRQMARPGAITGTSTPDTLKQRPQSPGNSIWMAETEWQSTPDSRHPVRYPLDATGQALHSGTHCFHPAPAWAMQQLTRKGHLISQSPPRSHPLMAAGSKHGTRRSRTPRTKHGIRSIPCISSETVWSISRTDDMPIIKRSTIIVLET